MNSKLMREFEEFEGLGSQVIDETIVIEEEDDGQFQPANASLLTSNDIYYEVCKHQYIFSMYKYILSSLLYYNVSSVM